MSERWLPVVEFPDLYEVSDLGRVRSCARGAWRLLKPFPQNKGYLQVSFGRANKRLLHRVVLEAFKGADEREGNHIDFDRKNCRLDNLEYMTTVENVKHSFTNPARKSAFTAPRVLISKGVLRAVFDNCARAAVFIGVSRKSVALALRRGRATVGYSVELA